MVIMDGGADDKGNDGDSEWQRVIASDGER